MDNPNNGMNNGYVEPDSLDSGYYTYASSEASSAGSVGSGYMGDNEM